MRPGECFCAKSGRLPALDDGDFRRQESQADQAADLGGDLRIVILARRQNTIDATLSIRDRRIVIEDKVRGITHLNNRVVESLVYEPNWREETKPADIR